MEQANEHSKTRDIERASYKEARITDRKRERKPIWVLKILLAKREENAFRWKLAYRANLWKTRESI